VKLLIAATVVSAICLSSLAQEPGAKAWGSEYQKSVVASKQVDTDQANQNDQHLMDEAHTLGLNRIEHDLPTPEENDRLKDEMRRSSYMQILS